MAEITLGGNAYPSYATELEATAILAPDPVRSVAWAALTSDQRGQGLISATRVLQRQCWAAGAPPSTDEPPPVDPVVKMATAYLAADIMANPALINTPGAANNIKRAKAGPAEVEFFAPGDAQPLPLPQAVYEILAAAGLLCGTGPDGGSDTGPLFTGTGYPSRFEDRCLRDPEVDSYCG